MNKLFILILIAFGLNANAQQDTLNRTDNQGRKTGYWISLDPSGLKVYEGFFREGKPVGHFIRFHSNGKTRADMNYLPDGKSVNTRLFDTDGRMRAEGTYVNQLKNGLWSFYSEKNLPVYQIHYLDGKVHGEARRYDASGSLIEQTQWKHNIINGLQIIFYPENKPQAKINYRDGTIDGGYELFFPDGTTEVTGTYASGLKTGKWIYNQPNGTTDFILNYKNGKLLNPEVLNARQQEAFDRYEKNRKLLKDPKDFLNNPEELMIR